MSGDFLSTDGDPVSPKEEKSLGALITQEQKEYRADSVAARQLLCRVMASSTAWSKTLESVTSPGFLILTVS